MKTKSVYQDLITSLEELSPNVDSKQFFNALQKWLSANLDKLAPDLVKDYKLDYFSSIKLEDFPANDLEIGHLIKCLYLLKPKKPIHLITALSRLFVYRIRYYSVENCPKCEDGNLFYLSESESNSLILQCEICTYFKYITGMGYEGSNFNEPTKKTLIEFGIMVTE